jgi:hypothetical protein
MMILRDIAGKTLIETKHVTIKQALEYCAVHGINLAGGDFRRARLTYASLDGLIAPGASFWGADLHGADLGLSVLERCDFRGANLEDVCLAESNLAGADCRGAFFKDTILEGAVLAGMRISCPGFWDCAPQRAADISGLLFYPRGERVMPIVSPPLSVKGLSQNLVVYDKACHWAGTLYYATAMPPAAREALKHIHDRIAALLAAIPSQNEKAPMPKIVPGGPRF